MIRRRWLLGGALVALVLVAGYWVATRNGTSATADAGGGPVTTAEVIRDTISDTRSFPGTLGHGEPTTVSAVAPGVVTGLAAPGQEVVSGTELFRVNERPVTALYGTIPMYRDLREGDEGADVAQLEANLAELGYTGFTVDGTFTSATAAAVASWQADLGVPETGEVARSDVVFVADAGRVDAVHTRVGATLSPGMPVLDLTGADQVVTVDIDVRNRDLLATGTDVTVRLPGGDEVTGAVTAAGARPAGGDPDDTTIRVAVTLHTAVDESLLGAPADVIIDIDERTGVLTVPVNALLAIAGGGHGVEIVGADGTTHLVPVDTGLFAGGRVEVTGEGIEEGTVVVVAGR